MRQGVRTYRLVVFRQVKQRQARLGHERHPDQTVAFGSGVNGDAPGGQGAAFNADGREAAKRAIATPARAVIAADDGVARGVEPADVQARAAVRAGAAHSDKPPVQPGQHQTLAQQLDPEGLLAA
jgi:hypothetical protein